MDLFQTMLSVLPDIFSPINLLVLVAGVLGGIIVGALPGLTPTMGVAILVPFTFGMSAEAGLILLGGVYCASVYAGAITAILFNIPGAPANIATLFDGYPMAMAGKGKQAIYYATAASLIGGLVGIVALLLFSPPLAAISLEFGPAEIFWVAMFGVTIIASLSVGSMIKGLIGGAIGLLLSTVGVDSVQGVERYVFDSQTLLGGIDIVAGLIGLFALSQVFVYFEQIFTQGKEAIVQRQSEEGNVMGTLWDTLRRVRALAIGSVVGTIIGIIPGAGGQVSALTAYNEAKRWAPAKERDSFGKGNPDGIISCEAANNAMAGGSLVPLFTLGIPGSPTAAVLLGGLMIHGLFPGHELFTEHAEVTYTFMFSMILAQIVMFWMGIAITRYMARILSVPKYYLGPAIVALCVIGAFATRNSMGDVYVMAALAVFMYLGMKFGFSAAAVVLGLILGDIAENGFLLGARIGMASGSVAEYFLTQPICLVVMGLVALSVGFSLYLEYKERGTAKAQVMEKVVQARSRVFRSGGWWPISKMSMLQWNLVLGTLIMIGSLFLYHLTDGFPEEPRLFPMILIVALIIMSGWMILQSLLAPSAASAKVVFANWPGWNMVLVTGMTLVYVALAKYLGFYASTFLFTLGMPIYLHDERKAGFFLKTFITVVMLVVFRYLLKVPTPVGVFF
jgi:putative tricarboxylic transport membrane protein